MIRYPNVLEPIFTVLQSCAIKPIIVGGFIRNTLLGIDSKDIDIELYNLSSLKELENILNPFGKINFVGASFGVAKLRYENFEIDFSLPREENKIEAGHRGFSIKIDSSLDFKTAASRRDFTINAIGYDISEKKLLDPFGGIDDLKHKILKAVNPKSFVEDPLRVLRAARFCAVYELKIDKELFCLCRQMVSQHLLDELAKERVFEEIKKIVLNSKKPSIGLDILRKLKSDIYITNTTIADMLAKESIDNKQTKLVLMLAALCYNKNTKECEVFLRKLTDEKELLERILALVKLWSEVEKTDSDYKLYKLAAKANIAELLLLYKAIYPQKNIIYETVYKRAKELSILGKKLQPLLSGKDLINLGLNPSTRFKTILDDAYEAQMQSIFKDKEDAIIWLKNYLIQNFS